MSQDVKQLQEAVLAAATLLWPEEDWGPKPDPVGSYHAYLAESLYEVAALLRKEQGP
jgi:hypothetical protein